MADGSKKFDHIKKFIRADKSLALIALEAFVKLVYENKSTSSQSTLFNTILSERNKTNKLNKYKERRFGVNGLYTFLLA